MKIKQQKQIKGYLVREFGEEKGTELFSNEEKILNVLIKNTHNRTENQMNTLITTILPRIALYKTLLKVDLSNEDVHNYIQNYMINEVAEKKHSSTAKMELVPFFYKIYSSIFLKVVRKSDLWVSEQNYGKDYFDVTMKKCLWHTACVENDCEELCPLFCDVDDITYGGLKKIGFKRTKTLGYGGDCCDFHFYKK